EAGVDPIHFGVDAIEAGVDAVNAGVDAIEAGVDPIHSGVDAVEAGVEGVEVGVDAIIAQLDAVEAHVDAVTLGADAIAVVGEGVPPGRVGLPARAEHPLDGWGPARLPPCSSVRENAGERPWLRGPEGSSTMNANQRNAGMDELFDPHARAEEKRRS